MGKRMLFATMFFAMLIVGTAYAEKNQDACNNFNEAGDYARAITAGKQAIKITPKSWNAHLCLGKAYNSSGNIKKAYQEFKKAETFATDKGTLVGIYSHIGVAQSKLGDKEDALQYFNKSLKISIDNNNEEGIACEYNNIAAMYSGLVTNA